VKIEKWILVELLCLAAAFALAGCALHWAGREVISVDPLGDLYFRHPEASTNVVR